MKDVTVDIIRHNAGWLCGPECPCEQAKQQMKAMLMRSVPELAILMP